VCVCVCVCVSVCISGGWWCGLTTGLKPGVWGLSPLTHTHTHTHTHTRFSWSESSKWPQRVKQLYWQAEQAAHLWWISVYTRDVIRKSGQAEPQIHTFVHLSWNVSFIIDIPSEPESVQFGVCVLLWGHLKCNVWAVVQESIRSSVLWSIIQCSSVDGSFIQPATAWWFLTFDHWDITSDGPVNHVRQKQHRKKVWATKKRHIIVYSYPKYDHIWRNDLVTRVDLLDLDAETIPPVGVTLSGLKGGSREAADCRPGWLLYECSEWRWWKISRFSLRCCGFIFPALLHLQDTPVLQ